MNEQTNDRTNKVVSRVAFATENLQKNEIVIIGGGEGQKIS